METPSSSRRFTIPQAALASSNNTNNIPVSRKFDESSQRKMQDRSALIDITNDSPIVGVAMAGLGTPLSKKMNNSWTQAKQSSPGSGEALLRGQVKTLLQIVEEEEAEVYKISPVDEHSVISQMVVEEKKKDGAELEKNSITRSLILDFCEKSDDFEPSDSTMVTEKSSVDDDRSSVWSIQVNASSRDGEGEETLEEDDDDDDDDGDLVNELCERMANIGVNGKRVTANFSGKHTRFVYDSDDEFEREEICGGGGGDGDESESSLFDASQAGILRLKGLPNPRGKHLRFPEEIEK